MRLVMVGGGGFRAPPAYEALLAAEPGAGVTELVPHDADAHRLARARLVIDGLAAERGATLPIRATTDR